MSIYDTPSAGSFKIENSAVSEFNPLNNSSSNGNQGKAIVGNHNPEIDFG